MFAERKEQIKVSVLKRVKNVKKGAAENEIRMERKEYI